MSDAIQPNGDPDDDISGMEAAIADAEQLIADIAGLGNLTLHFAAVPRRFTVFTTVAAQGGEMKIIGSGGTLSEALSVLNESLARAAE